MKFISLRVSPPIQALYTVVWYWIFIVDFEIRFCTILSYISWKGAGPEWNITQCHKKLPHLFCTMHIVYTVSYSYWPTQPGNPLVFRVFTVISFSVFCSTKVWSTVLIMDSFLYSRCPNYCIELSDMTGYLKVALLAP